MGTVGQWRLVDVFESDVIAAYPNATPALFWPLCAFCGANDANWVLIRESAETDQKYRDRCCSDCAKKWLPRPD
jgi:hypothetical protein